MVVNKDTLNTENWRISDLASHIPEEIIILDFTQIL